MLYSIPVTKFEALEKRIRRANKKGGHIICEVKGESTQDGTLTIVSYDYATHSQYSDKCAIKVKCIDVEIEGIYKINGWELAGTVEHKDLGNVIRLANSTLVPPERYYHTAQICEHCGTLRRRKDTYLIHNEETDEWKQVGKNCLMEYTMGLDANICAEIMSTLDYVRSACDYDCCEDDFFSSSYNTQSYYGIDTNSIKPYIISLIKKFGYNKKNSEVNVYDSSSQLRDFYFHIGANWDEDFGDIELATEEEVNALDEFAMSIKEDYANSYMTNAKYTWLSSSCEYRDFALLCSFVAVFNKEQMKLKLAKDSNSQYVGNIGDRIELTVSASRVLYSKGSYSYYGPVVNVIEIKDDQGNTYIWSTSGSLSEGMKIKATVKDHKEYKGVKQTIITRGTLIA